MFRHDGAAVIGWWDGVAHLGRAAVGEQGMCAPR